ncbi:MAG: hypothetical protein IJW92_00535 [Clostridia bacterium]|nr:hypothetical protein [Clostridia bacterium]
MFQKNDYVFYESGGICRISDIQTAPLEGMPADREYYVLQSLHDSNGVIYIPVDSDRVFLRRLLNREEAESFLNRITQVDAIDEPNAKLLRTRYTECMRMHTPEEWVRVIKTVWRRTNATPQKPARISDSERGFSENAKRYLYTELSLALGISAQEMERYIAEHIQKMA